MRRAALLLRLLCLAATPAAAQVAVIDPHTVFRLRPTSCALADSLAGRPLGRAKENSFGWATGDQGAVVSNGIWEISGRRPLDAVIVTATFRGIEPVAPHPDAGFALQIRMKDSVLRTGPATTLTLVFDDSTEAEPGEMDVMQGPMSTATKIDQVLTVALRPATIRRIAAAKALRGRLGTTAFQVPPKTLEQMRSAFIATTCGVRIR